MNARKPFDLSKLAAHRARLLALGYRRSSVFLSPQLRELIARHRRRGESVGAVLDRLLLSEAATRPPCSTADNGSGREDDSPHAESDSAYVAAE